MGAGSFTADSQSIPLARPARKIGVFRYDPGATESERYTFLPNVRALTCEYTEGPHPPTARFRYSFGDPTDDGDSPTRFEEVYPLDAEGDRVVYNDDRLVIRAYRDDGGWDYLFDGFPSLPQADVNRTAESVTFEAFGTPIREWDSPLAGQVRRSEASPAVPGKDVATNIPARFNPDGEPNATPGYGDPDDFSYDTKSTLVPAKTNPDVPVQTYPCFIGPRWPNNENVAVDTYAPRAWTVPMALRYIILNGLATDDDGKPYLDVGDMSKLDALLQSREPLGEGEPIDPADPATYKATPIEVEDMDVTGMPWPEALETLLKPYGFNFNFRLDRKGDDPHWRLEVYRKDEPKVRAQTVQLQSPGDTYDPSKTNVNALRLARDAEAIVNQFVVDTALNLVESSFVLWPGFKITSGDASDSNSLAAFIEGDAPFTGDNRDKYRVFIYDETESGHWDVVADDWVTEPGGSFDKVLEQVGGNLPGAGISVRRRPGQDTLITLDDAGKPRRAELWVSDDYPGEGGQPWDEEKLATWVKVPDDKWELLPDRLGIRFTVNNPNSISLGEGDFAGFAGKLTLVKTLAPSDPNDWLDFRLTCVIESDQTCGFGKDEDTGKFTYVVTSPRRPSSPTEFAVERRIDRRSRYVQKVISIWSHLANPGPDQIFADDTPNAQAEGDSERAAHQYGAFAGTITFIGLRYSYRISDKITYIKGRNVSLCQNIGREQGESPIYPTIVSVQWELESEQTTTINLNDHRASPPVRQRRKKDRGA